VIGPRQARFFVAQEADIHPRKGAGLVATANWAHVRHPNQTLVEAIYVLAILANAGTSAVRKPGFSDQDAPRGLGSVASEVEISRGCFFSARESISTR